MQLGELLQPGDGLVVEAARRGGRRGSGAAGAAWAAAAAARAPAWRAATLPETAVAVRR